MTEHTPDRDPSADEPRQPLSWGDATAWMLVLVWVAFAGGFALLDRMMELPEHADEIAIFAGAIPFLYLFAWAAARSSKPQASRDEVRRDTWTILKWMGAFAVVTSVGALLMLWFMGELG